MKKGFTLVEVLITLAIIGIVAAITLPTLIKKNFEKCTITQLRATQSILANAIKMAEEEHGTMDGWVSNPKYDVESELAYGEKLKPFLKVAHDCGTNDPNDICMNHNCYKSLSGNCEGYYHGNRCYSVKLFNGSSICIRPVESSWGFSKDKVGLLKFYVDTNGSRKPNQHGIDLFTFIYHPDYGLVPGGTPGIYFSYKETCNRNSSGFGCMYYISKFNNMKYLH